jgi:hypothetical protein
MEQGDLALSSRPTIAVVLEGVLASVTPIYEQRRIRAPRLTGHELDWHDVPLARVFMMKRNWPQTGIDVVTFVDPAVAIDAADFLNEAMIPVDSVRFHTFERWVAVLRFQPDLRMVVDSDQGRLDRYGQLGRAVLVGEDFHP